MMQAKSNWIKRTAKRAFRVLVAALMILQTLWMPNSALAADSAYAFKGYGAENMSSTTLSYATNAASVSGRSVTISPLAGEGEAVGHVALNEGGSDISPSVDLGGLEVSFSAVSNIALEGENGVDNDTPTIRIYFCSSDDIGSVISSVTLTKQDGAVAGNETLSSGAGIPSGTRSIFISLKGTSKNGNNTVTFSDVSLVIRDAGAPSCSASYTQDWTNQDVTVTVTAVDSDAGLEGIYIDDVRMSGTSPYIFTVSANNTSFTAYAMDLADKKSDVVTGTIDHIDKTTPTAPSEVPLSSSNWTNTDVSVLMPALGASTGSPERYVYQIGSGAWATLPDGFAITAEGSSIIRVAVEDAAGNRSASAQATAKIDKSAPTISNAVITSGSSSARVDISATEVGSSGLEKFMYAAGTQTADYFTTGGTPIVGSTFTVSVGGDYTIFASDYAGNTSLKQISITTAPTFNPISDVSMREDTTEHVVLSVSDAESSVGELSIVVSVSDNDILDQVELIQTASEASLNITPIANVSGGPVTITVDVEDPSGQKVSRSFTVTVNAANDDPVAADDQVTLSEDGVVEIDVLHNDTDDADLDTLSISDVGLATNGTTLLVLGKIRYTPDENFVGTDSFLYTISDGNDGTSTATVYITVEQVNDAPTAVDDAAATAEDSFVFIGVLDNDFDVDKTETNEDEAVALVSSGNGAHGSTRIVDGLIEYTPDADFNGTDEFTYTIEDLAGLTDQASVTVTVSPEVDAPRFSGLTAEYTIDEDAVGHEIAFEIYDVETPQDSLMLQAATLDEEMIDQTGIEITGLADEDPAVQLLLTPVKNQFGDVNIKLTLGDGFDTVEQTIIIHIINVNDAPRAGSDTRTYTEDAEYVDLSVASLLAKHSDIDGDTITFDRLVSDPSVGSIQLIENTTVRYFPVKDYDGSTSFTYYITDGTATTLATCTLEAIGVNDEPMITVTEDQIAGTEDAQIIIPFRIEDNESDVGDLSVIVASADDSIVTTDRVTIVKNSDGTGEVQIQPEADANGTVNITLTVSDGEAHASDSVDLVLAPAQDAPIAEEDFVYVHYTTRRTFNVLVNDHDVDGDVLSGIPGETSLPGTLTFDEETQTFSYVPAIGENGTSTFTYTITDGLDTSSALVTLDVISETHAPVITAIDSRYINEDGTASGIAFSVSDEDIGDTASISVQASNGTLLPADTDYATITDLGSGNYSLALTPAADQAGSSSVTVTVTDGTGLTDSTTFYLYVIGQNDAPVAVDDTFTIDEDSSLALTPVGNDMDPDEDTLWLSSLTSASHGYIEHTGRSYVYYPYENWSGTETLTYRVSDGRATDEGTITITVDPVNDAPVAWSDWQTLPNTTGAEYVTVPVLSNDYDVDTGDVIHTVEIVTQPSYGAVVINADGSITYTRNQVSQLSNGADSFEYRIIDRESEEGDYRSATAHVYIGVEFHGSLYTYGRYVSCFEDDDAFNIDLSVSNPDGVTYTLTVNSTTTLGVFEEVDNDTVRFTPAPNQYGYANITYTVAIVGGGASATGTIWLRVYPVNDLPEITYAPASITMDEDTSAGYTFDVNFHDEDCSNRDLYFYVYTQSAQTTAPIPFMASYSVSETTGGRQVTIKTADNVNGTGKIVVGVSDGMTYDEAVIDLTVTPVDDAPLVKNVNKTIREDSAVTFASPGSDSEVDGESITETIDPDNAPQHGHATINANRTITYVPDADFYGVETFNVIVTDETTAARSTTANVTITVNAVNDPPEILDLGYYQTTMEDEAKVVTLTVMDVDNDMTASTHYTLTSSDQKLVKNENIAIGSLEDGQMSIHIVPEANAYGTLKISILASDGSLSAKGAFSLTIVPVNDLPYAVNDVAEVDEVTSTGAEAKPPKTTATINLLANDSDVEDGKPRIVAITNIPAGVTVTNKGDGSVLVSTDGDYSGNVLFSYKVMDRAGAIANADVLLIIKAVNDPPRAKNESVTISEDETKLVDVLSNDSDPEGDLLTIDGVGEAAHGTTEISGTKVSYTPDDDYFGTDSFTYTISDGNGGTATATVYVTIKPVNDVPTVGKHSSNADAWVMLEDEPKSFHFVVADAESATNNLIIKITSSEQTLVKNTQIALSTNADGYKTIRITPVANAHGDLTLTLWVSDGLLSAQAVIPLSILCINDAPVVTAPAQTTKEDTSLTASATATDADGDPVKFALKTAPLHGTVTVREDGTYDYLPALDFNGIDHFTIVADDNQPSNNLGSAIVYINVKPDGDAPVAQDDTITINEDIATTIPVLDNDTDQDLDNGDAITILRATTPAHGTTAITTTGILYTPKSDFNGVDSFQYTITDKDGKLDTASVSITIRPVNDAPRGGDDTATVLEDHSVDIDVTVNDDVDETTNPDAEDVTILSVDKPTHGTATYSEDRKTITYTPDADWFSHEDEPEVFYYTAKDSADQTERFAVSVTVTSVNDLPVITPETLAEVTTAEDTLSSAITFNVSDIETAAGSLEVTATHLNGVLLPPITVSPDAEGNCSFAVLPNANKVGNTTITVKVTDADGGQDTASFLFTVTKVNDVPTRGDDIFTVAENGTYTADVLLNDDVDTQANNGGDTLTLLSVETPEYGNATIVNNKIHYVPKADRDTTSNYQVVFYYTMKDLSGSECTPKVTVTVTPVNDAPTISTIADVTGVLEDAPNGTGDVSFNVTDEEDDDDTLTVSIACDNTTLFPLSNISITNPTGDKTGSLRTVKAVPAANQFGTATITLTVRDGQSATAITSFDVTVDSVNDIPLNGDKSFTVVEDVERQLDVLEDIDPDYATTPENITITGIAVDPSHGTVRIAEDGKSIYYTTAQDSNVADMFRYTIHDSYDDANYTFTVDITVTPVNDAPVVHYAAAAEFTMMEGSYINNIPFTVTDVDNVTFAGGTEDVEVTLSAKSSNSILLYNGIHIDTLAGDNRDIDLQPYLKWNGKTTVTITATDPAGLTGTAFFKLVVNNVDDVPVAVNDMGTIPEDQTSSISVLSNDTDADLLTNPDTEFIKINTVTDTDPNATITKAADGLSVTVVPNANYNGPVSFTYTIIDSFDAESNVATVNLTVSQVNDAPVTQTDTTTTNEDTPIDIFVLANDTDIDKDEDLNARPEDEILSIVLLTGTTPHGAITTNGAKITYTPSANYNGTDTFTYYCSDGDTSTAGTVSLTVYQVNDPPVAAPNTVRINEDTPTALVDVLTNDLDVDIVAGNNLNVLHLKSDFSIVSATLTNPAHGTVEIISNKLKFTPALNWFGSEVVNYTMSDGHESQSTSKLTVTVDPVNDPPVYDTAPEDLTLSEDGANGVTTIVVSDIETAAAALTVTVTNSTNPTLVATSDVVVTGTGGTRTVTVNPRNDQNGQAVITLVLSDGDKTATEEFTVTVTPVNDAPVALDKIVSIDEDAELQTYTKASLASDVDVLTNGDSFQLTITKNASHGTAEIDVNGNVTYVPTGNYNGTDSFEYTATDDVDATGIGTFSSIIGQVNDAPTPVDDIDTVTNEDTAVDILVLTNDTDIDKDALLNANPGLESISIVIGVEGLKAPSHGTIASDGAKITYTPDDDYNGTDTFEYFCSDGDTRTKASVTVTVLAVNDDPIAIDKIVSINEDADLQTYTKASLTSDVDIATNDDSVTLTITEGASHGTAGIDVNGNVTYVPNEDFNGTDSFTYTATDESDAKDTRTFSIIIGQVNDAPTPVDDIDTVTNEDTAVDILVLTNDTDIDQDKYLNASSGDESLSVVIDEEGLKSPLHGDITTDGTTITYTPDDNYNGTDTFEYYCSDGDELITASVTVTITQVDDDPAGTPDEVTIDEDSATGYIDVLENDTDVDLDETLNLGTLHSHDTFFITSARVMGEPCGTVEVLNNEVKFTPFADWNGIATIFYTFDDGYGLFTTTALRVYITSINDLPEYSVAPIDLELTEDGDVGSFEITVTDVETAKDELTLTVSDTSNPTLVATTDVTVESGANGLRTITVNPKQDQNGTAVIELTLTDKDGGVTTEEFAVTVSAVNDDPIAFNQDLEIDEDAELMTFEKTMLTDDVDIATNDDSVTLTITKGASHGTAAIDTNGNVTYVPTANYNGTDSFEYTATDEAGAKDIGTFNFTIAQVNDAPTPVNDVEKTTKEDTAVDILVLTNDTDIDQNEELNVIPEDETLSVVIGVDGLVAPLHGDIVTDGTKITYTPDDNYNGPDTFEYYCSDDELMTKATVEITITQVNDSPAGAIDETTTQEDTPTDWIDVMANDTDVDLNPDLNKNDLHLRSDFFVRWATVQGESIGTVEVLNNELRFTPAHNWFGTAVVHYCLDDKKGGSSITALVIEVEMINDPPVFTTAPIDLELIEDRNDGEMGIVVGDPETVKDELTVTVTKTSNPTLIDLTDVTIVADENGLRTITVNPKDNQNGTAVIELTLTDKDGGVTIDEFTVTVLPDNDAPVAIDKALKIDEDADLMTFEKALLASDVDIATNEDSIKLTITKGASHGTATIDVDGNVTYVPNTNFNGLDSFTYTATDEADAKDTGTFSFTIAQVNDAPTAGDDFDTVTQEDTAVNIFALANDDDVDKDKDLNASPALESISIVIDAEGLSAPLHGDITTDGSKITYTPDDDFNGTDTFEYYCADGDTVTRASVKVTIKQVNDNPIANDDSTGTKEDTAVSVDVLENDTDVDTLSELNLDDLYDKADFFIDSISLYGGENGSAEIEGASIRFTPDANFYGTQVIKYVLKDGNGGTSTGTLTILVGSEFDSPNAVDDAMSAAEDHTASVNVLTNDTDNDPGDTKTFVGFVELPGVLEGTFDTDENGDVSFTPNENYNGSFEAIYQVRDSAGLLDTAKLTVTITPVNDVPVANDGTAETDEDKSKDIDVLSLIGDVDILTNEDVIAVSVAESGEPMHGTVQVSGTTITYTPDKDFNGADEITYTVTDSKGESDTGKLTITIHAVNDAPVAKNDTKTLAEDTAPEILVRANDQDIDTDVDLNLNPADAPYILSVEDGAHGTATTDGSVIIYTPDEDYNGVDTIEYSLTDGIEIVTASVNITITQVNDEIVAVDDADETNDEDPVMVDVLLNDTDVDTDAALNEDELHLRSSFRITAVGEPENGTASIVSGKIEYTPEDRFAGTDIFTYTVSDGHGETATGTVTITVHSVNDPPVILKVTSPKDGDRAGTGSTVLVEWTSFDIDGDALTYRLEYFDGKDWVLVSDGLTDTNYLFAIPSSLGSVDGLTFRVNASDSEFTSDYGYSGAMKVDQDAPKGTIVTMKTADGRAYTAGTWTNQTVTVVASNSVDDSKVVYYYGMDTKVNLQTTDAGTTTRAIGIHTLGSNVTGVTGTTLSPADSMDVITGVHYVHITAVDEYGNATYVGSYLARVDKQQPAVPDIRESISGGNVVLTLTMNADPGNSGNDKLTLPDNSVVKATGNPTYSTPKNGTYNFNLVDVAGNRRSFTYTVTTADTSKPVITLDAGDYRIGSEKLGSIKATLTFTDAESEITSRGYSITSGSTAGAYRAYEGTLTLTDPGTYYIHAYAKNAFGLTTYETFGPFIIVAPEAPADTTTPTPTPAPTKGDVIVDKEDVEEIPGDTVSIRIPGHEWSETLTLEGVGPGTYLIEAMDADGNIRTVEVRVTMRDIIARSLRSNADKVTIAAIAVSVMALCAILLLALLAGHNITIVVNGSQKKLRTFRRIKFKKKELAINLSEKQLTGGTACSITIAKSLSKGMRGNTIVVSMRGFEVLREQIPENFNEAFKRTIRIAD